jgi:hypothetical protein
MRINSQLSVGRAGGVLIRTSQNIGLTKVLGGVLLLGLFQNPIAALGVTLPPSYSVTLAWDGSTSAGIAGYRVYYGTTTGIYTNSVTAGNVTTNTVTGLAAGVTYFFAVTSYDTNALESPFSSEISYTAPTGLQTVGINVASNRQVMVILTGQIGQTYNIQATRDFKTWSVIGTVTIGSSGSVGFIDTNASNYSQRFYRTQQ